MSRKMIKNEPQKKNCGVCGDIAMGRNFGAITCESCKAFFRRTAFKTYVLNCNTNGKCVINTQSRKSCKKCRLNKCLAVGMIKELILKNNEKLCLNFTDERSERNRADSIGRSLDSNISSSVDSTLIDREFDSMFENCCLSDEEISKEIMEIEDYINSCGSVESETVEQQRLPVISMTPVVRPIATYDKDLNDIELNRLQELSSATNCLQSLFTPFTQNIIEFSTLKEYYTSGFVVFIFDESVQQFVQFCKRISSFQEMCEDDQLALVKYGYFESVTWQHLLCFNFDQEDWVIHLTNGYSLRFSLEIYKSENVEIYDLIRKFFKKLSFDLILDPTLRNLLSAVTLFNPNRPNVNHRELIKLKQQMYLYLLQRYLLQKYRSEYELMEKCSQIFSSIEELEVLTKVQKEVEKDYKEYMTPLLKEFLE